jgi:hypothetical protein
LPAIDLLITLAGLIVGFVVGLTGMGGGALMTPILVIIFRVQPLAAIGSDLVASLFMKPVGSFVHWRRGTVETGIVKWLILGSVPAAFAGVFVIRFFGAGQVLQSSVQLILGIALVVASVGILGKSFLDSRAQRGFDLHFDGGAINSRPVATVLVGAAVGLIVGMTSVGSGSLMIVLLMLVYPMLNSRRLVGTDLVQAVPLVGAAALGHVLVGDFKLSVTLSILLGSIPGVYLGSRLSASAPDLVVRPILVFVLVASALKLLNFSNTGLAVGLIAVAITLPPIWGLIDIARWQPQYWVSARQNKDQWVWWQGIGTILPGIGLVASIAYFVKARPRLVLAAAAQTRTAGEGSLSRA